MEVILNRRFVSRQIHLTLADEVGEKLDGIVKRYRFRNMQAALGVLISRFCKHVEVQECTRVPVRLSIEDEIDDMFNELERLHIMPETTLPPRSHRTRPMDRSGRAVRVIDAEAVEVSEEVVLPAEPMRPQVIREYGSKKASDEAVLPSVRDIEKALALPENALAENGLAEGALPENVLPEGGLTEGALPENVLPDGGFAEGALSEVPEVPEAPEKGLAEKGVTDGALPENALPENAEASEKGVTVSGALAEKARVSKKKGGKK